ncbi:MAG: rhodanese-like domain-containing protein [Tenericutes bacterium]|nr:rhodanese-like domain-containing protein [Mycoplasmatota bacterium]
MRRSLFIILCLVLLSGCKADYKIADEYKATYKTINQSKTEKLVKEGNTIIIDVRSEKKYNKNHIKDAINIPSKRIDTIINEVSKDSIVVVYSDSKKESKNMSLKIIDMGYSLVYDFGLYKDWK